MKIDEYLNVADRQDKEYTLKQLLKKTYRYTYTSNFIHCLSGMIIDLLLFIIFIVYALCLCDAFKYIITMNVGALILLGAVVLFVFLFLVLCSFSLKLLLIPMIEYLYYKHLNVVKLDKTISELSLRADSYGLQYELFLSPIISSKKGQDNDK